jgi:hypothetical protein
MLGRAPPPSIPEKDRPRGFAGRVPRAIAHFGHAQSQTCATYCIRIRSRGQSICRRVCRKSSNWILSMPFWDVPTKHRTYAFPLESISLRCRDNESHVPADVVQLTRWRAYYRIDRIWWKFSGPFVRDLEEPEDRHWKWGSYVRRLRKNPWARCAAARTPDLYFQGAIIYRRDGRSLLEPGKGAAYIESTTKERAKIRDRGTEPPPTGRRLPHHF